MVRTLVVILLAVLTAATGCARWEDYADARHVDDWLRHPVLGDPSFDAFERVKGNPLHRGTAEFAWPVNASLFVDPVGGNWYVYIGEYKTGYGGGKSRCILYRSRDRGRSWENLGPVLSGDATMFDRDGHVPDATVAYDGGRYHMVYDWGEPDFNREGGLAYAWADRPEGPWHRAPEPITRRTTTEPMNGRYTRTYAATLLKRERDWLILGMTDVPPTAWAMFAMTAPTPQGPWSAPVIVREPGSDYYHPPLLEFFPAFTHDRYAYAPATSVAANRNFNVLFRAPLDRATEAGAWEVVRHGSVWHAEAVENEHFGIWGQTFAGQVIGRDLWAVFPSRDARGVGTVNLARRPWDRLLRDRGFVLSGHEGPAMTVLRRGHAAGASLDVAMRVTGTVRILLDGVGPLGADSPASGSAPDPAAVSRAVTVEVSPDRWRLMRGAEVLNEGARAGAWVEVGVTNGRVTVERQDIGPGRCGRAVGLWADRWSRAEVERFRIRGEHRTATVTFTYTEALLGAGRGTEGVRYGPEFRNGLGAVVGGFVKWNVWGTRVRLWCPRGPEFGRVAVVLDGREVAVLDLGGLALAPSAVVWDSHELSDGPHAVVVRSQGGQMPVDSVDVDGPP